MSFGYYDFDWVEPEEDWLESDEEAEPEAYKWVRLDLLPCGVFETCCEYVYGEEEAERLVKMFREDEAAGFELEFKHWYMLDPGGNVYASAPLSIAR